MCQRRVISATVSTRDKMPVQVSFIDLPSLLLPWHAGWRLSQLPVPNAGSQESIKHLKALLVVRIISASKLWASSHLFSCDTNSPEERTVWNSFLGAWNYSVPHFVCQRPFVNAIDLPDETRLSLSIKRQRNSDAVKSYAPVEPLLMDTSFQVVWKKDKKKGQEYGLFQCTPVVTPVIPLLASPLLLGSARGPRDFPCASWQALPGGRPRWPACRAGYLCW